MSSVAHLQKSNKKKVGDFALRINQRAVVSSNISSLAEAKELRNYGLTVARNGIKSLILQYKVIGLDETFLAAVR